MFRIASACKLVLKLLVAYSNINEVVCRLARRELPFHFQRVGARTCWNFSERYLVEGRCTMSISNPSLRIINEDRRGPYWALK
jgi:hypothetical protein